MKIIIKKNSQKFKDFYFVFFFFFYDVRFKRVIHELNEHLNQAYLLKQTKKF